MHGESGEGIRDMKNLTSNPVITMAKINIRNQYTKDIAKTPGGILNYTSHESESKRFHPFSHPISFVPLS